MAKLPEQILKEKTQKILEKNKKEEEKRKAEEERKLKQTQKELEESSKVADPIKEGILEKTEQDMRVFEESSINNEVITDGAVLKKSEIDSNITHWKEKIQNIYQEKIDILEENFFKSPETKPIKLTCSCCGTVFTKSAVVERKSFQRSFSLLNAARRYDTPYFFQSFCRKCGEKLFKYYFKLYEKDEVMAMRRWCCDTNNYWDVKCLEEARKVFINNKVNLNIISEYLGAVARSGHIEDTFWNSPFLQEKNTEIKETLTPLDFSIDWEKEDILAKSRILKLLRSDPFENQPEESKSSMYRALDFMIEPEMEEDYIKLQAAIEIVIAYQRIDKLRKEEQRIESADVTSPLLKPITELKKKEFDVISKLSADQGFNVKSSIRKSKGVGTLTYAMDEMEKKHFQPSLENYYDAKTCQEIQDVANMSMEAIFKQIALSAGEYGDMINTMRKRILEANKKNEELEEKIRKLNIMIEEKKLIEKAKKEGLWTQIDEIETTGKVIEDVEMGGLDG